MAWLNKVFGGQSKQGAKASLSAFEQPQNRTYEGPPEKSGQWGLIVDKYGDEVTDRLPNKNDFVARYPVEIDFRGTIPAFDSNDYLTRDETTAAAMEHAMREHRNESLLKKALFLVSQDDDGRRLLDMANRKEFHFVFDEDRMNEEGAVGMCDYTNKQIPLAEGRNPEQVALTIKHELQHMEDNANGISYNANHTLSSSLMANRALEANARTSEAVFAASILHGNPNGPERQFRTSAVFAHFHQKNTPVASRALGALNEAKAGNWSVYAREAFEGYFDQHRTLDFYDKRQAEMFEETLPKDPNSVFDPFTGKKVLPSDFQTKEEMIEAGKAELEHIARNNYWTQNQDELKEKITIRGQASYLTDKDGPDLSDARHTGLGETARDMMNKFINRAKNFIPNTIEQMETAIETPVREVTEITTITPAGLEIEQKADDFKMIKFPNREGGHHSNTSEYADTTRLFKEEYENLSYYQFDLERISLTIESMNSGQHMNMRGIVHQMIDSGFRAPLAAMPQEYIIHLCRCADYAVKSGETTKAFDEQDLQMMKHWSDMSEHGLDPTYGRPEFEEDALYFKQDSLLYFNSYLKPFFDKLEHKQAEHAVARQQLTAAPA